MLDWLWKWMGYHVCEEFTRWEIRTAKVEQPLETADAVILGILSRTYIRRWQERQCTICGRVEQRELKIL